MGALTCDFMVIPYSLLYAGPGYSDGASFLKSLYMESYLYFSKLSCETISENDNVVYLYFQKLYGNLIQSVGVDIFSNT